MRRPDAAFIDNDTSRFDIARRRIGVEGEIGNVADFQIEREFADRRPWRDVYLNYRGLDRVQLQAGQFKLPFGLDENTSSTNLDFVYRSRAARLSPGRDPGLMAHGRVGVVRYEAGAFTQDGDNGRAGALPRPSGGWTTAGRLLVQPLRSSTSVFEDFQAGVAYTSSDVRSGIADLRGPSALRDPFFRPEFAVQGMRRRVGLETRWRPGPFSVQSELVRMSSERLGQSVEDLGSSLAHGLRLVRPRDLGRHRREEDRRRGRTETAAVRRRVRLAGVCSPRRRCAFFQRRRRTTVNRSAS